ncbi:Or82a family protein [Megaselia abdita]
MYLLLTANFCKHNVGDLELLSGGISIFVIGVIINTKSLSFFIKKKDFFNLLKEIKNLNKQFDISNTYAKIELEKNNLFLGQFFKVFYFFAFSTLVVYAIIPTIDYLWQIHVKLNNQAKRYLPLNFKFPIVDDSESPYHEICTVISTMLGTAAVTFLTGLDCIFLVVSSNLKTHFEILQDKFRNSRFDDPSHNISSLKSLVLYHIKLLELTDSLNNTFKEIIFGQIVLTAVQMCLILFQILQFSENLNLFNALPNYCFFMAILLEFFMYCYGGQLITNESFNVSLAIQESSWYNLRADERAFVLIMMARTQKPLHITSGVFVASLDTFGVILKTACSYVTFMRSF